MAGQFDGKVAFVTGAASGIGKATAQAFAREGAKVALCDIQETEGMDVALRIREEGGQAEFHVCDTSQSAQVREAVAKTVARFGRLDFAGNIAGTEGQFGSTADCEESNWDKVIGTNLKGTWLCMKYEVPEMLKQGGGAIVNISSCVGLVGWAGLPAYVASKHGVIGLTRTAALDYATQGIRVNVICPGAIHTPMVDRVVESAPFMWDEFHAREPMRRLGRAEEIADAVIWLCSSKASFVTGHPLSVDGGWVAQ